LKIWTDYAAANLASSEGFAVFSERWYRFARAQFRRLLFPLPELFRPGPNETVPERAKPAFFFSLRCRGYPCRRKR